MDLKYTHDIEDNVFSTVISVDALGTEQLSEDEEREMLHDFPTKLTYRNLTFSKNIKMVGSNPTVTEDETGDSVVSVTLPALSNKEILLDENFKASYAYNASKIPTSAINNVLTTKELVAQAYCAVYDSVIIEAVSQMVTEIRSKAPTFAGEGIVSL